MKQIFHLSFPVRNKKDTSHNMPSYWHNDQRQGHYMKDISSRLIKRRDADKISNGRVKIILASPFKTSIYHFVTCLWNDSSCK